MNHLDTLSRRILVIAVSVSIIFLSASLFLFSLNKAYAKPEIHTFSPVQTNITGKYICSNPIVFNNAKYVYVLNTETGDGYWKY